MMTVPGDELPELYRQSEIYLEAWRERGLSGEFIPLPGHHHFTALEELARPTGLLTKSLATLVS
jgi:arylformamidase